MTATAVPQTAPETSNGAAAAQTPTPQDAKPAIQQPATDQKPQAAPTSGDKPADGDAKPTPAALAFKAPEFDGMTDLGRSMWNSQALETFTAAAKELGLSQENGQKLLGKLAPVLEAAQVEKYRADRDAWANESRGDKEFGGDKLPENLAIAKKAIERFGGAELVKVLNETGYGDHPAVIRTFYRAGKAISEDKFVGGGRSDSAIDVPMEKRLYPNMA